MGSEGDLWKSPTESELVEIKARRERSDKISKIMSEYLLKGYRMLANYCPTCMNIMMEDKQGHQFCIACDEIDKQPPSSGASIQNDLRLLPNDLQQRETSSTTTKGRSSSSKSAISLLASPIYGDDQDKSLAALNEAKSAIIDKLKLVTKQMTDEENTAACVGYASMIKVYAETLTAIGDAMKR